MATVYRGLDRSLKRQVAIKILHKHLADYQEARDRFEREAQAVAKLRHENILEIFDYSGAETAEALGASYIVTEFIEGQTLKQVITDRPLGYPEVGALIMLQVCRALAHAHGHGILHRDVKPENIMIRADGVVKLMDFGISQMVDLERLTVTGQLLGSPAYMAPEHVEGRPLDFRTDVFAVGIVLYQLAVGRLPFEGKNPHEVLKRIAECRFVDPRQANPRVGNQLGRIILRAMAAAPDDRFPAIGEMVIALETFLTDSGMGTDAGELARFFGSPVSYEQALHDRLVDHLTRRGQRLLPDDRAAALDAFDRVLTIDPANAKVLEILERLHHRRRLRGYLAAGGLALVLGGGVFAVRHALAPPPQPPPPLPDRPLIIPSFELFLREVHSTPDDPPPHVIALAVDGGVDAEPPSRPDARGPRPLPGDAGAVGAALAPVIVRVSPPASEVRVGDGPWASAPSGQFIVDVSRGDVAVAVRNEACCEAEVRTLTATQAGTRVVIPLPFLAGQLVPQCDVPGVVVRINGQSARLGKPSTIPFGDTTNSRQTVTVEFVGERIDTQKVVVTPKAQLTVSCAFR
jgi:serine/threonine-protein kinase